MNRIHWIATSLAVATVLVSLSGCGNITSAATSSNSVATSAGSAPSSQGGHRGGMFQPTIDMKVNPSTPKAGKLFTLTFSLQRPNLSGNQQGNGGNGNGNWSGGQGGTGGQGGQHHGGNWGSNGSQKPTTTAQITGNSVNQTVKLRSQNRSFEGSTTIKKPGIYQVTLTMNMGQRQIKKQFTLKIQN